MSEPRYANVEDLATGTLDVLEEDFETLRGARVRLRGMTRTQVLKLRKLTGETHFEPTLLVFGMAQPELTLAQAQAWEDSAPAGELEEVANKIYSLSGMDDDAGKQAYKSFRGESGA